ncbi:MAG: enoyl-CoA hydratase/isomerase family protein [Rhodoferax sp.]|nr:enoyl-CoA hydratase/isomerase family protein [Rhodoferax sp.]
MVPGTLRFEQVGPLARITLCHTHRFNAMTRLMWRELRVAFEHVQLSQDIRCVVVAGEGSHFCSGGDISEYAAFRFQEASLREFHEGDVWGGLQAMLDCDVPIVAQIAGNCMGAGVEIASCCDIRVSAQSARFGAPIAKLGFPMAPREAALVAREVGAVMARQMLLEAALFGAHDLKAAGFLSRVVDDDALDAEVQATALRIAALAPQAARMNKQTLRELNQPLAGVSSGFSHHKKVVKSTLNPYAYANSAEHREGIQAFLDKRKPAF